MFPLRDAFNQTVFMELLLVVICIAASAGCQDNPPSSSQLHDASDGDASLPDTTLDAEDSALNDAGSDMDVGPDLPLCPEPEDPHLYAPVAVGAWRPPFPKQRPQLVVSLEDEEVGFDQGAHETIRTTHKKMTLRGDNGEFQDVEIYFPIAFPDDEVVYPTPGEEVYATGVSCDAGDYTVLENAAGEVIWEGGSDTCQCVGDTTGFESICQPTRRFTLERQLPMETLPQCISRESFDPACHHIATLYPATLQTDTGVLELPLRQVLDVTINQRPYKAIYTSGGFYHCPCGDDCSNFLSTFLMLPAIP